MITRISTKEQLAKAEEAAKIVQTRKLESTTIALINLFSKGIFIPADARLAIQLLNDYKLLSGEEFELPKKENTII